MQADITLRKKITAILDESIKNRIFPGAVVGVISKNNVVLILPRGRFTYDPNSPLVEADTVYDVASITKSIPTSSLALYLIDQGKLSLTDKLITFLPEYQGSYREDITLFHLLTQTLHFSFSLASLAHLRSEEIIDAILNARLLSIPGITYHYANATSILLGMVIEKVTQKSLETLAREVFFIPLKMNHTTFHPRETVPPTEILTTGESIQGIVHDESAKALLPRIVGSAGLFSSTPDLLCFLQMLLFKGRFKGRRYFSEKMVEQMYTNQIHSSTIKVSLGWELSTPWMGNVPKKILFGKTGFTGCMITCDVTKGIGIAFLTNRNYPDRHATGDTINQVRSSIIEAIFNAYHAVALV